MSSPSVAPSYAAVLRTPHALRTFAAALLGRLSYGVAPLSLVLAVKAATGSYAVAGTVMAVFGLTGVLLSPARAGLIDRHGPRRVLPPMACVYAVLLTVLAFATAWPGAPGLLLAVLASAAGATTPPLGPVMRTLWSTLLSDRPLLQRAYSLDGVAEELLFVTGPLLVGVLMRVTVPSVGLGVSAVLVLVGALSLVASPAVRAYPVAGGRGKAAGAPEGSDGNASASAASAASAVSAASDRPGRRSSRFGLSGLLGGGRGLRQAIAVTAGLGIGLGALDLLVIAFAEEHDAPGTIPWIMAALSAGSAVGGLAYGAVSWRAPIGRRLAALAVALGLVVAATGLAPHPYVLVAGAALGGLFVAPALTTAYLIADESAGPGARTKAGAWVNTAFNAGSSGSTAAAGLLIGHMPLPALFALAAAPVVLSAVATSTTFTTASPAGRPGTGAGGVVDGAPSGSAERA
ncbi:MFS transporter [Streptomyces sp. NPDC046203]|uniref:MFS transporter n=1 Tax=Streptomyces sp. NPDC046203 TaxID=3154602 RepID=UPI0033E01ADC